MIELKLNDTDKEVARKSVYLHYDYLEELLNSKNSLYDKELLVKRLKITAYIINKLEVIYE